MDEPILNVGTDAGQQPAFTEGMVQRATENVVSNAALPQDFAAQYPTPLNTEEIIAMCEEVTLWRTLPSRQTGLKQEIWREMNELAFTSGSSYISFADYACPEEFYHDGDNKTVDLKNIGAKKSLGISDIIHSRAVAAAGWNGINTLVGPFDAFNGLPGTGDGSLFARQHVADVKEKEMRLAATLVLNQADRLLAVGNKANNSLEFDGIETLVTAANGAHTRAAAQVAASGTFAATDFDKFISESCAAPTDIFAHPQAAQELLSSYFQLWGLGTQVITYDSGERITPGYNFAGEVRTARGTLRVHADANFTRTAAGATSFTSNVYALRMVHNGEPLVYKTTQIPLAFKDLAPGCTAISFMIWSKLALVIKAMCAQSVWNGGLFSGRLVSTCPTIY